MSPGADSAAVRAENKGTGPFGGPVKVTGYLKLKTITGASPAADCNEASEAGRVVVRTDGTVNLYVCRGTGGVDREVARPSR